MSFDGKTASLQIINFNSNKAGTYECVAKNEFGEIKSSTQVTFEKSGNKLELFPQKIAFLESETQKLQEEEKRREEIKRRAAERKKAEEEKKAEEARIAEERRKSRDELSAQKPKKTKFADNVPDQPVVLQASLNYFLCYFNALETKTS